jgi:LmbE family N-acetylglucosaminyl deacetylase
MSAILLAPHNDDETLFAAYTCLRFKPLVAVCFQSISQERVGISRSDREAETAEACAVLGVDYEQWEHPDDYTAPAVHLNLGKDILAASDRFEHCYAPMAENDGHEQHNQVHDLAVAAFGYDRVTRYMTYRRGSGRSRGNIAPREKGWPAIKLRAMACYQTQIELLATRPWFECDWLDEWYA